MLKIKFPRIFKGKYFIRQMSKKTKQENSNEQKQQIAIDSQEQFEQLQSLFFFPLKNQPIFPENSFVQRINPYFFQKLIDEKVKYVSAFLIQENIEFQTVNPEEKIQDQENKDDSLVDLTPQNWDKSFHQNIIYDDNISNLPYIDSQESPGIIRLQSIDQIHQIGTMCKLTLTKIKNQNSYDLVAMLKGVQRIKAQNIDDIDEFLQKIQFQTLQNNKESLDTKYQTKLANLLALYIKIRNKVPINVPELIFNPQDPRTVDLLSGFLCLTSFFQKKQLYELFEILSIHNRINLCYEYFNQYEQKLIEHWENLDKQTKVPMNISQSNEDLNEIYKFLKKQMQNPLKNNLIEKLREKGNKKKFPEEIFKIVNSELSLMEDMPDQHPEFNNKKNFIELIMDLPFNQFTEDKFDLQYAKKILDDEHYGLEDVKERILEFIAVSKLLGKLTGRTILLTGPPGVGKTSIAKSIANCLGRKFAKISLGGENDVSIIKGHRKTYLGAYPGKIIQALKNLQSDNPVILLDEIDKIGIGMRGNIQDALLEVLDPAQNKGFVDNFLDFKYDLSQVLFICTANLTDTINPPLLDRLEIIKLSGYIAEEKLNIAKNFLVPKALEESGLKSQQDYDIKFEEQTLQKIINDYARESGVRNLQRQIIRICEKMSLNIVTEQQKSFQILPQDLKNYIGLPIYSQKKMYEGAPPPGIMIGLAYNSYGGNILYIETIKYNFDSICQQNLPEQKENQISRKGFIKLTGSLGDVMQESVQIAYSYAKYFTYNFLNNCYLEQNDIHIHFPEGSSKKDGPSAGMAITASLVSLAIGKGMKQETAMTGEISLKGKILKIGGVKEKVLAAKRENVFNLILPLRNKQDVDELSENIKSGLNFHFVENFYEIMPLLFPDMIQIAQN